MSIDSLEQAFREEPDLDPFIDESEPEDKYSFFLWDRYDWDKFDPRKFGYNVIRLMGDPSSNRRKSVHSGKYFTIVTRSMYAYSLRVVPYWYPLVEYYRDDHGRPLDDVKRITAHNTIGPRKSRKVIYLHRVLAEAEGTEVGDHINGYSLDNRNCNLRPVSVEINNHNVQRMRTAFPELWPGVEWVDTEQTLVRGVLTIAGKRIRSDIIWPLEKQEEAWKWVAKKKHELLGLRKMANGPITVPLPEFPPLKRTIFPVRTASSVETDIPF